MKSSEDENMFIQFVLGLGLVQGSSAQSSHFLGELKSSVKLFIQKLYIFVYVKQELKVPLLRLIAKMHE